MQKYQKNFNAGMSLVEMIVSLAIFLIVMLALVGFVVGLYRAYYYSFEQTQAVSESMSGVETMIREIKEATMADDGSYMIEKALDFEFVFYGDIDRDSSVERVRYFLDGTNFKKGVIKPQGSPLTYITSSTNPLYQERFLILSRFVRNAPPIFRYFDGNLQELPAPARLQDTKLMRLNLIINVTPSRAPNDFSLESEVQLRNLKNNL
ncbi:MAG: prepilin-type N-terminal cleavage/methylation domain-containing protein [Candidatus Gribaldobacteria bacterium]|nr:prepilin-type N-terminal cleavage/methylation domain-containing protein [Candidatus Gribaldobacteria bacterium]